jgi:hypothetical protein
MATGRRHTRWSERRVSLAFSPVEVDALVLVAEQELSAVLVVGVFDGDEGVAEVGELGEQLLFDRLELARVDLEAVVAVDHPKVKSLCSIDELRREKLVNEHDVGVERAHLEDLLRPRPSEVPVARSSRVAHSSQSLPNWPRSQRSSMWR